MKAAVCDGIAVVLTAMESLLSSQMMQGKKPEKKTLTSLADLSS